MSENEDFSNTVISDEHSEVIQTIKPSYEPLKSVLDLKDYVHLVTAATAVQITITNIRDVADWIHSQASSVGHALATVDNLGTISSRKDVMRLTAANYQCFASATDWIVIEGSRVYKLTDVEFKMAFGRA